MEVIVSNLMHATQLLATRTRCVPTFQEVRQPLLDALAAALLLHIAVTANQLVQDVYVLRDMK